MYEYKLNQYNRIIPKTELKRRRSIFQEHYLNNKGRDYIYFQNFGELYKDGTLIMEMGNDEHLPYYWCTLGVVEVHKKLTLENKLKILDKWNKKKD